MENAATVAITEVSYQERLEMLNDIEQTFREMMDSVQHANMTLIATFNQ
jgi:hypothetical protein